MTLLVVSVIAGILTVLAPCILPLLPVVLGGTAADVTDKKRPFRIVFWLSLSVFVFTFLLRVSTVLIDIPEKFWTIFAGVVIGLFGLTLLFPLLWDKVSSPLARVQAASNKILAEGNQKKNTWGDILMGIALGPIFTTCSPTYFVILAAVLPESFTKGSLYILGYIAGLAFSLLIIAFAGQKLLIKLNVAADPRGWFKRTIGFLFIVLGLLVATGYVKKLETALLDSGYFDVTKLETTISEKLLGDEDTKDAEEFTPDINEEQEISQGQATKGEQIRKSQGPRYEEIVRPDGFVNSEPFALKDIVGQKVILLDFMTYSCINCQRTFPYLNDWYTKYKDDGLEIVGIHTPEFAFERKIENVEAATKRFGLEFPLVLDNSYATWTAYANRYWPHKYLINIHGEVVYDHIGEGAYEETEAKIVELLNERKKVLGEGGNVLREQGVTSVYDVEAGSRETYFGASRNSSFFGNGIGKRVYEETFSFPDSFEQGKFYLDGTWNIAEEYIETSKTDAKLSYYFDAKDVYLVAESDSPVLVQVLIDGKPITSNVSGGDVINGVLTIHGSRLFHVVHSDSREAHEITFVFEKTGVRLYTFTFG